LPRAFFAWAAEIVAETEIHRQLRCHLEIVLIERSRRQEAVPRVNRLVRVKRELRSASDQAGNGPALALKSFVVAVWLLLKLKFAADVEGWAALSTAESRSSPPNFIVWAARNEGHYITSS